MPLYKIHNTKRQLPAIAAYLTKVIKRWLPTISKNIKTRKNNDVKEPPFFACLLQAFQNELQETFFSLYFSLNRLIV